VLIKLGKNPGGGAKIRGTKWCTIQFPTGVKLYRKLRWRTNGNQGRKTKSWLSCEKFFRSFSWLWGVWIPAPKFSIGGLRKGGAVGVVRRQTPAIIVTKCSGACNFSGPKETQKNPHPHPDSVWDSNCQRNHCLVGKAGGKGKGTRLLKIVLRKLVFKLFLFVYLAFLTVFFWLFSFSPFVAKWKSKRSMRY